MNRLKEYALIAGRTLTRTPLPNKVYEAAFGKVRVATPTDSVLKKHAVDVEMAERTRVVWLDKHKAENGVIVYLHGGGYTCGPFAGEWAWLSEQADALRCAAVLIDYRYGPDYIHPAALIDARAALRGFVSEGLISDGTWVLVGHQSGAGLALALAAGAEDSAEDGGENPIPAPGGIVLMNPWLDLELNNLELSQTQGHDPVHERRFLQLSAKKYAGRTPLDDPELSPINRDLGHLPPVHLSVGLKDLFLTDCRVAKLQAERQGLDLHYREIPGRIRVNPRLRGGEDMQRLMAEQQRFISSVIDGGAPA